MYASNVTDMEDVQALGSRDAYLVIKSQCFAVVFLQEAEMQWGLDWDEEEGREWSLGPTDINTARGQEQSGGVEAARALFLAGPWQPPFTLT